MNNKVFVSCAVTKADLPKTPEQIAKAALLGTAALLIFMLEKKMEHQVED